MKYTVKENTSLMQFLVSHYPRKQVKLFLKYKQVYVNGKPISQFDYPVVLGDSIQIQKEKIGQQRLDILYEDSDYLVINKPAGLLSMSDGKEKQKTAYHVASEYVKQQHHTSKIFIVHRLDRETSGVLLFAKNEQSKKILQEKWNHYVYKREYIAIVEGYLSKKEGTIKSNLAEDKTHRVYVSKKEGKLAITKYQVLQERKGYSVVKVMLQTGRKNQIRVHMASLGHGIVNDKKYGAKSNPLQRLGLHAYALGFTHPKTKQKIECVAPVPDAFTILYTKQYKQS